MRPVGSIAFGLATAGIAAGLVAAAEPLDGAALSERLGIGGRVLVSTWDAGFPDTVAWRRGNVTAEGKQGVALRLGLADTGRPIAGAEFQTLDFSTVWGRVEWEARLPAAPSGSVAAMFLYVTPHDAPGLREFDLEYLPRDPKNGHPHGTMQMAIHMRPHDGGPRASTTWRIDVPERCVAGPCGWAIEVQPARVAFGLRTAPEGGWRTVGLYRHGEGWDAGAGGGLGGAPAEPGGRLGDGVWSERTVNAFASYWAADDLVDWLGPLDRQALADGPPPFVIEAMRTEAFDRLPPPGGEDWSLDGDAIVLRRLPAAPLEATGLDWRVDGGPWRPLGPARAGRQRAGPLPPGATVEIRSVARGPAFGASGHEVVSPPSAPKTVPGP